MLPTTNQPTPEEQQQILDALEQRARESYDDRQPFDTLVEQGNALFAYGKVTPPAAGELIVHEIQTAVITNVEMQTREMSPPKLDPVETGEPPTYFWDGPAEIGLAMGVPMECLVETPVLDEFGMPTGETQSLLPLEPTFGEELTAKAVSKEMAPMLMPGQIRPEWVVALDDRLVADFYQSLLGVFWKRSRVKQWLKKNVLDVNNQGWAWGSYQWSDEEKRHILDHLPVTQVYVDPMASDIGDAVYAGYDRPYDADYARASFPDLIDVINEVAAEGRPTQPGSGTTTWASQFDKDFKRDIVVFRVFWLRHQLLEMSEEEAVASGKVIEQEVLDEASDPANLAEAESGNPFLDQSVSGDAGSGGVDPMVSGDVEPGDMGSLGALAPTPAARIAYLLPDTLAEVTPGSPGWPTRTGTRQVTVVYGPGGGQVVDYRESEFANVPILHNVNIPFPGSRPYGISEPYRLAALQAAASTTLTAMVDHADHFAHPSSTMSESMHKLTTQSAKTARSKAGSVTIMPDEQWMANGGKTDSIHASPPISPALMELLPVLKSTIQEQSGNTPIMRGIAPSANASGKMVDLLQNAGASMMSFKADRTGDMSEYLVLLMNHSHVWRLSVDDVLRIVSKYSRPVTAAIVEKAREMEWNVTVDQNAGTAQAKMAKAQNAMAQFQLGLLSKRSTQEACSIDARVEEERQDAEQQKLARQAAMMAPPPGEGEEGESDEPSGQAA